MDATASRELRIVSLAWDRTHEQIVAIVRAESRAGVVVTEVQDLCEAAGRRWIRADEIVDIDDLEPDDPHRRVAELRGSLANEAPVEPTELIPLLRTLLDRSALIAVYTARTGSTECLVGRVRTVQADRLVLAEVDPNGRVTRDELEYDPAHVIGVDWDTDYLTALADLVAASTTP